MTVSPMTGAGGPCGLNPMDSMGMGSYQLVPRRTVPLQGSEVLGVQNDIKSGSNGPTDAKFRGRFTNAHET